MKKLLAIVKYDLIKLSRDTTALVLMFVLPLVLTLVMGLVFGNSEFVEDKGIPVGITDNDSSLLSQELLKELKKEKSINLMVMGEEELRGKLRDAQMEIGFIIPAGFGERIGKGLTPEIKVMKLPQSVDFPAIESILVSAVCRMYVVNNTESLFAAKLEEYKIPFKEMVLRILGEEVRKELEKPPLVSVNALRYEEKSVARDYDTKALSSIGMAVVFVMFTLIIGTGDILEEKKINTWYRLRATPTSPRLMVAGKVLGVFATSWIQLITLILFGKFVFGVNWGRSPAATVAVMSVYLFCVICLGMLLSSLVRTSTQLEAFSAVFIITTSMLAGCYWPIEIMPSYMQKLAVVLPQYWAMRALNSLVVGGMGFSAVTKPVFVLLAMGTAFLLVNGLKSKLWPREA